MTDPTVTAAAQALLTAWDSPRRWSNPGFQRVQEAETALREALGTQTTDEVLWGGETEAMFQHDTPLGWRIEDRSSIPVPPGTRVRVVRATDQPSEDEDRG